MKKLMNIWKSTYTGATYMADADWMPQYGGWELIGSCWVEV